MVSVDNDVEVFLNGVSLGFREHDFCPVIDEFRFDALDAVLNTDDNVLAVRGVDRGGESFLDLRVLFECPADDDDDNDGLNNSNESIFNTLLGVADSDGDGMVDGNDDANGNGRDDEDEDDDDACPDPDDDVDGIDNEDEDDPR